MKNFKNFTPEKYSKPEFQNVEEGIYKTEDPYGIVKEGIYVTSLSFEAEPDCYGEKDSSPKFISQVPFEALLDEFLVSVTDFYEKENEESDTVCYQEFGAMKLEDIQKLRTLIGKRFYAEPYEEDGEEYYKIVIE